MLPQARARPNRKPASAAQPKLQARAVPRSVETASCPIAPGSAVALTEMRLAREKCRADREEQQDNPDLCELVGQLLVGHKSWREGANYDAGKQIADQR